MVAATTDTARMPIPTGQCRSGKGAIMIRKWIFVCLLLAATAAAQSPESLLIGPGDLLHVQVFDTPELEQHARVTDAGELPLILGANVKVVGLTPAEAARV